jgi:hypothetical protein
MTLQCNAYQGQHTNHEMRARLLQLATCARRASDLFPSHQRYWDHSAAYWARRAAAIPDNDLPYSCDSHAEVCYGTDAA